MSTAVAKQAPPPAQRPETEMEFTPFQSETPIKLSVAIVQHHICVRTRQGHICDASQAIKFMMLCRARRLNPFEGDAYLVGYDTKDGPQFSLITAIQAFYKRAEVHPEFDGIESGVIVSDKDGNLVERVGDFCHKGDELLGGWATVYFKNRSHPRHEKLNLHSYKKPYGRWNDDPAGMIVKCAEASCLRTSFPTQLGGMYLDGETQQVMDVSSTSSPSLPAPAPISGGRLEGLTRRLEKNGQQQTATEDSQLTDWEDISRTIDGELAACQCFDDVRLVHKKWSAPDKGLDAEKLRALTELCVKRESELNRSQLQRTTDWEQIILRCVTEADVNAADEMLFGPEATLDEAAREPARLALKAKRESILADKPKGKKQEQRTAFDKAPNAD